MEELNNYRPRKPNNKLSLRRRNGLGQNLTSNDQVNLRKTNKLIYLVLVLVNKFPNDDKYKNILRPLYANLLRLKYVDDIPLEPTRNFRRNIASFGQSIKKDLRFEAQHIRLLIKELKFPV